MRLHIMIQKSYHVEGELSIFVQNLRTYNLGDSFTAFHGDIVTVRVEGVFPANPFTEVKGCVIIPPP